jgi:hypothetical protein
VEKILELDYRNHCVVVLLCKWVKAKYNGPSPTIIRDDLGFTVANFNNMVELGKDSFAFPIHCQQVFFSEDPTRAGWKEVCRIDVRGRRGDLHFARPDIEMLAVGLDSSFHGLQVGAVTAAAHVASTSTTPRGAVSGRHICTIPDGGVSESAYDEDEGLGDWHS